MRRQYERSSKVVHHHPFYIGVASPWFEYIMKHPVYLFTVESKCLPLNPCQNGGTCTEAQGSYKCDCTPGWTGLSCEGKTTV